MLCLGVFSQVTAQTRTLELLDSENREPIPFATIVTGPQRGTISNDEGYFSLDPASMGPEGLRISCMGYQTLQLDRAQLEAAGAQLLMVPSAIQLNEVQLGGRTPTADEIIRLVREKLPVNYPSAGEAYQLFYRESEHMQFDRLDLEVEKASDLDRKALEQADARLGKLGQDIVKSNARKFLDFSGAYKALSDTASVLRVDRATELVETFRKTGRKDFKTYLGEELGEEVVGKILSPQNLMALGHRQ